MVHLLVHPLGLVGREGLVHILQCELQPVQGAVGADGAVVWLDVIGQYRS